METGSDLLDRELKGIGVCQGDMVTMVVADNNICAVIQSAHDFLSDFLSDGDLKGMRKESMTLIAKSDSGIDDYFAVLGLDDAGQAADA